MEQSRTNRTDLFQNQLKNFKALLSGSKMATLSAVFLATFSLVTAYMTRSNLGQAIPLLLGSIVQIVYIFKYLQLDDIKQKSYTQKSLKSSVVKFKVYMSNRKKYEMFVMSFWIIMMVPYALNYESTLIVVSGCILYIVLVSFFGSLAFKKVDNNIELLEATLKNAVQ
nr:hypothetical protein [uncultured Psychroserpens sp.]